LELAIAAYGHAVPDGGFACSALGLALGAWASAVGNVCAEYVGEAWIIDGWLVAAFLHPPFTTNGIAIIAKVLITASPLVKIAGAILALLGACDDIIRLQVARCFVCGTGYVLKLEVAAKMMLVLMLIIVIAGAMIRGIVLSDDYGNGSR